MLNKSKNSYFYIIYNINEMYNDILLSADNVQPTYLNKSVIKLLANFCILSLILLSSTSGLVNTYKCYFILETIIN